MLTLALAIGALPVAPALAMDAPSTAPTVTMVTWVATWQASPQRVWSSDFLFPTNVPAVLDNQTVRQVARVSVGGPRLRIVLSNAYGNEPISHGRAGCEE